MSSILSSSSPSSRVTSSEPTTLCCLSSVSTDLNTQTFYIQWMILCSTCSTCLTASSCSHRLRYFIKAVIPTRVNYSDSDSDSDMWTIWISLRSFCPPVRPWGNSSSPPSWHDRGFHSSASTGVGWGDSHLIRRFSGYVHTEDDLLLCSDRTETWYSLPGSAQPAARPQSPSSRFLGHSVLPAGLQWIRHWAFTV